jgi:polyphosphate:AMP phosphotransferase
MFEAAELGRKVSKEEYQQKEPALRTELLKLQFELRERDFPVIVSLSGNDRASCNEVLNVLHEWMDPRFLTANAWGFPTQEETEKPFFWRYWQTLPPKGRIGIFLRGWTMQSVVLRLLDEIDDVAFERLIGHVRRFEQAQVDDGALIVKFWFHLPEKKAKKRLKAAAEGKQPIMMVKKQDLKVYSDYDRALSVMESALRKTSRGETPWHIVESSDERYRNLTVAEILHAELSRRLEMKSDAAPASKHESNGTVRNALTILDKVDLTTKLPKDEYQKSLKKLQRDLNGLSREARREGVSTVLVFEGWDAAGKGGIVRRLTAAIDASLYRIIPVAAPTEEERAHQYLWRFWRHLPRAGQFTIFDRSWYGRVLVERVEGFATKAEWRRAYAEINDFEEQLCEHGNVLLKFWLHIDKDEQLKRFQAREQTPFKKYKITEEDYRNRERWNEYELAANDMIERTSTENARWHLVAANDKRTARVNVIRTVCHALEKALKKNEKK